MGDRKRSLTSTGGRSRLSGDPEIAAVLGRCLDVDPDAKLPFTHGFHAYPARMHPETARRVIEAFPGGRIVDPFVGSGTTAVEAVRAGRPFVGLDISKVPLEIAWARTRIGLPEQSRKVEQAARRVAGRAFQEVEHEFTVPPWVRAEQEWYDPHTLREICVLKLLIDGEEPTLRRLLTVVLSSVLVKLSRQISDSDVKKDLYHRPRPRGAAFRWFRDKSSELTKGLLQLSSDLYKRKVAFLDPELRREDAREARLGGIDLVVTSPPYAGVYDYSRHQSRRYPIFDEDPKFAEAHELGSRRDAGRYREDMELVLKNLLGALSPHGRIVMMIGDGQQVKADAFLTEVAAKLGAKVLAIASQSRKDWSGGPPKQEHLIAIGH
jgi:DNA modification methylase